MPKLVLGSNPDEINRAEAERMRELEAEVQARQQEQSNRIKQLVKKERRNKIIIISFTVIAVLALIGTTVYQAFIKPTLTSDDVSTMIANQTSSFDKDGIQGYIYKNFEEWFNTSMLSQADTIEYVSPDMTSLTIDDISQTNYKRLVSVDFSIDIDIKQKDTKNYETNEVVEGLMETKRYYFSIPIEMTEVKNNNGDFVCYAYQPASTLRLTFYESKDIATVDEASQFLAFPEDTEADKDETEAVKVKLNRLLSDLYAGKDVGKDLTSSYDFKTIDATFIEITDFEYHTDEGKNAIGSNARCVYTIETDDGVRISTEIYCVITKNGSTYSIGSII